MPEINSINSAQAPLPVSNQHVAKVEKPQAAAPSGDTVEISPQALLHSKITHVPEVRSDLVARVKAEIAAGTYDTPEKLDIAIGRLMDELSPL